MNNNYPKHTFFYRQKRHYIYLFLSFILATTIGFAQTVTLNKTNETCPDSNDGTITPSLSGGVTNIRYIKFTQQTSASLAIAEVQAYEVFTGTNVALASNGGTATQSSTYYAASRAIDGNLDNFSHTAIGSGIGEWLKVDLQSAKNLDYVKVYNRSSACCSYRGANMLIELLNASGTTMYSKTIDLYQGGANEPVIINVLDLSWADGATTLNRTSLDSGTYTLNYSDVNGNSSTNSAIITSSITAPTIGTITQSTCDTTTGSVVLSDLPSSGTWTLNQSGASSATTTGTGTSTTISGLSVGSYTFTVTNDSGCTSTASSTVTISAAVTNTWDGSSWDNGTPSSSQVLVFNGLYSSSADVVGCSAQVNAGVTVNFNSGNTLTLTNELTVASTASVTFFDSASLVQINAVTNTGEIEYQRTTGTVRATDYVYWSSPVANQDLGEIATEIANGTYYKYDPSIDNWSSVYTGELMGVGTGYIVRRPDYVSGIPVATESYTASFVGVPTNGAVSLSTLSDRNYLIGNPYPSAINADDFLTDNSGSINGTLYFWTQNTEIQLASDITDGTAGSGYYAYTSNDYATYNTTGGVAAASGGSKPNGYIAAAQGFFCSTQASPTTSTIVFSNSMRTAGTTTSDDSGVNEQFFKTSNSTSKTTSTEKSRIWLNMTNTQGAFKQTLIGYITDATNGFDTRFDGASYDGNDYIDFYSINEDTNLTIQGRALPFETSDEVPLGYKTTIEGDFTISIDETDGSLADQAVYLEDKVMSSVSDLRAEDYTFTTTAGTFDDRFVLVYKNGVTLSTTDFESSTENVIVSCKSNTITVNAYNETLDQIFVYDLLGRQLYKAKDVNSNEYSMTNLGSHQTLLVKVILENGTIVTKKIVY